MNEVYIFFGASVAVSLLAIVTFSVVLSYHKALKEKKELLDELAKIRTEGSTEAEALLTKAHEDALTVIKNAELKAQELFSASDIFSQGYKAKFQQNLLSISSAVSGTINTQIEAEMKLFRDGVSAEMVKVSQALGKSFEEGNAIARKEVEDYKKQMIAKTNLAIFQIVQEATKKSLAMVLTREEHEKAILKALEEAKKQNVF